MSDLRFNAIAGTVLASLLGVMALNAGSNYLFAPHYPEKAGFMPDVPEGGGGGGETDTAPEGPPDWGTVFADTAQLTALVERGDRLHAACTSCHTFEAGGANGTGPNLHDVFGRSAGTHAGFGYSDAMRSYAQPWTYDNLYAFLESPSRYIRGTSMAYAGLRRSEDRQALVAYLRSIGTTVAPLPPPRPAAAPAEEGVAPAGEIAAPTGEGEAPAAAPGQAAEVESTAPVTPPN